jgi:DNA-directed RNA polymerase subunit L
VSYLEFTESFNVEIIEEDRDEVTSTKLVTYDVPKPFETSPNFKVQVEEEEFEELISEK